MIETSSRFRYSFGFTLVEMMVVLLIMASLVTVTTVSVDATRDKVRIDKTASIGREVVEALERSDVSSFVSDFGRLPETYGELMFLFSDSVRDENLVVKDALRNELRNLDLPDNSDLANSDYEDVERAFGSPTLSVGWNGPYCPKSNFVEGDDIESALLDGWKNPWQPLEEGGSFVGIQSLGRDGAVGGANWQDEGQELPLYPLSRDLTDLALTVQVSIRASVNSAFHSYASHVHFDELTFKVLSFSPGFPSGNDFAEDASTENISTSEFTWEKEPPSQNGDWSPTSTTVSGNPFLFTIDTLTAGNRALFVYAYGKLSGETNQRIFVDGVRLIQIQPGTNRIDFSLTEL